MLIGNIFYYPKENNLELKHDDLKQLYERFCKPATFSCHKSAMLSNGYFIQIFFVIKYKQNLRKIDLCQGYTLLILLILLMCKIIIKTDLIMVSKDKLSGHTN